MSEPIHSFNIPIVTNGDMSSSINSTPINLDSIVTYSVQAVFTGTPSGTLQLQGSNDNVLTGDPMNATPTNWTVIVDSISGISTAGTYTVNVEIPGYSWVRLQYVRTAGSGTLNARINGKRR